MELPWQEGLAGSRWQGLEQRLVQAGVSYLASWIGLHSFAAGLRSERRTTSRTSEQPKLLRLAQLVPSPWPSEVFCHGVGLHATE